VGGGKQQLQNNQGAIAKLPNQSSIRAISWQIIHYDFI
jgi:hypothetical protein